MPLLSVRRLTALAVLALAVNSADTASAQFFGDPCCCPSPCGPSPIFRNPFDTCCAPPPQVACAPAPQPIAIPQVSYQQVPTVEYRPVQQTVQRPVVETAMVDQPVTEYRTVYENRTAQVPSVEYQTVTEYRTVQRDCGRWQTNYVCRPQVTPCEYDNRPNLLGWMNRNMYSARMAVTPKMYAQRQWVPNVVAQQIPMTRQVAIPTTKTVAYQTAKVVPYTTTRKVAVSTTRMVAEQITVQQPVTVMKTVPVTTTAYAWGYPGMAGTATAFAPLPANTATAATLQGSGTGTATVINPPVRTARGPTPATPAAPAAPAGSAAPNALTEPGADEIKRGNSGAFLPRRSTFENEGVPVERDRAVRPAALEDEEIRTANKIPTAVRAHHQGWIARNRAAAPAPTTRPSPIAADGVSVAKSGR